MSNKSRGRFRFVSRSTKLFYRRIRRMVATPVFIALSIFGNSVIFSSATLLYFVEKGHNPNIHTLLDTVWWAVSTVTTVGYGDVIPVTNAGKLIGIGTMILGTALFWSYTALFAEALISDEIVDVESELQSILAGLERISKQDEVHEEETQHLIRELHRRLKSSPRPPS